MKAKLFSIYLSSFVCAFSLLFTYTESVGQIPVTQQFDAGQDTTICPGHSVTLTAHLDTTDVFAFLVFHTAADDQWSGIIPMPFPFIFYDSTYSQCIVGSNGVVGFNIANAGANNTWSIPATPFPQNTPADLKNTIMGPWQDLYLGAAGSPFPGMLRYGTYGTAPERIFFVEFVNDPVFSCQATSCFTTQVQLFENGNYIESHIESKTFCSWNGGKSILGLQNQFGTVADILPPTQDSSWTAFHQGILFAPDTNHYTISPITYSPVVTHSTSNITWYAGGVPVYEGWSITVSPSATTTYTAMLNYGVMNCDSDGLGTALYSSQVTVTVDSAACDTVTSIGNLSPTLNREVELYPNPSKGIFSLKLTDRNDKIIAVKVTDIAGREIYSSYHVTSTMDLSHVSGGVYFVHVVTLKNKSLIVKAIKD